jgi:hypothetical protein
MSGVGRIFLMVFNQLAIAVIYFLPQPGGFFKLCFWIKDHFLEQDLPASLAAWPPKPIAAAIIGQILPMRPIFSFR